MMVRHERWAVGQIVEAASTLRSLGTAYQRIVRGLSMGTGR